MSTALPRIPASLFGIVLGLSGAGQGWRLAHRAWGTPAAIGEVLLAAAALIWALLLVLYIGKWMTSRSEAQAEIRHPVQCCFVGLIGVATMLIGLAALPWSRDVAIVLCTLGSIYAIAFGVWRTGLLWRGGRDSGATTAVLYLPTVAGSFVTAISLGAFGLHDWAQLAFGAGAFSWLAIESVLLGRLYHAAEMPAALRPTLGIQLAPPTVGLLALLASTEGAPGLLEHALLGYGLLQLLLLARQLGWVGAGGFAASFWGYSFGMTAVANAPLVMLLRGDHGAIATLAPWLFGLANIYTIVVAIGTLILLAQGRLLPAPAAAARVESVAVPGAGG